MLCAQDENQSHSDDIMSCTPLQHLQKVHQYTHIDFVYIYVSAIYFIILLLLISDCSTFVSWILHWAATGTQVILLSSGMSSRFRADRNINLQKIVFWPLHIIIFVTVTIGKENIQCQIQCDSTLSGSVLRRVRVGGHAHLIVYCSVPLCTSHHRSTVFWAVGNIQASKNIMMPSLDNANHKHLRYIICSAIRRGSISTLP